MEFGTGLTGITSGFKFEKRLGTERDQDLNSESALGRDSSRYISGLEFYRMRVRAEFYYGSFMKNKIEISTAWLTSYYE